MGYGDQLIAAALAARFVADGGKPCVIRSDEGKYRWNELWERNPAILPPTVKILRRKPPSITVGRLSLPYLDHARTDKAHWHFHPTWQARDHRPSLYFTQHESEFAQMWTREFAGGQPFILVESAAPDRNNSNRNFPHDRLQQVVDYLIVNYPFRILQLEHHATVPLDGVALVPHSTFRQAASLLACAAATLLPEGGLAHAAAATDTPAVVLWGGCMSSAALGYSDHLNIQPVEPCGSKEPGCAHCTDAWDHPDYSTARIAEMTAGLAARRLADA